MTQPVVLILASGRGERFRAGGGRVHKLQAELGGISVLERTLQSVRDSGLPWHLEDAGHPGMGDSIASAVRATRGAAGWLVLPADLPLIEADTLRQAACALRFHPVVAPVYRGQRGHPVGFAARCGDALAALQGDNGAAAVVRQFGLTTWNSGDAGCVCDIDTPADLRAAAALLARRQSTRQA